MVAIEILRQLSANLQFDLLVQHAEAAWQDTQEPACLLHLALGLSQTGYSQQAGEAYRQACETRDSWDLATQVDELAALIGLQQQDKALVLAERLIAKTHDHYRLYSLYGLLLLELGARAKALEQFQRASETSPADIISNATFASLLIEDGHFERAEPLIRRLKDEIQQQAGSQPENVRRIQRLSLAKIQIQFWAASNQFAAAEEWLSSQCRSADDDAHNTTCIELLCHYARQLAQHEHHEQAEELLRRFSPVFSQSPALHLLLAELLQLQGRYAQAANVLRKCLALHTGQKNPGIGVLELWIQLTLLSLQRFDGQARYAAQQAQALCEELLKHQLAPDQDALIQAKTLHVQAMVKSQEQMFDQSERLFKSALQQKQDFTPALQGLGQQYMQQGKIQAAVGCFEQIKTQDAVKATAALINARQYPTDDLSLAQLDRAAQEPSLEGKVKAALLFQLAHAWEHRGDFHRAFGYARQANAASRKFISYNAQQHRNTCARIRMRFCKALFEHRPEHGLDTSLPVYIVGMPRSGTTLVEQILAGHSQVFGAGELGIVPQVKQGLQRWERHVGSGRDYPDCMDDLGAGVSQGIARKMLEELTEFAPDARYVIDKLPHNFENIGLIKFLFPKAKIISVRRDPRDIAISNYFTDFHAKHGGMGYAYDLEHIGEQLADHNLLMHHWRQLFPEDILEVHYEDVVDNLEASTRRMLAFLDLRWEPQTTAFDSLQRPIKTASVWQVRQPVYKSSKAKWRRYAEELEPLIRGANKKIQADSMEDMITLPEPGLFTQGVELFRQARLDAAELSLKKMLHHVPGHGGANYMVGLIYLRKNHPEEGIALLEKAVKTCPWQQEWQDNLQKAYRLYGQPSENESQKPPAVAEIPGDRPLAIDNLDTAAPPAAGAVSDGFLHEI